MLNISFIYVRTRIQYAGSFLFSSLNYSQTSPLDVPRTPSGPPIQASLVLVQFDYSASFFPIPYPLFLKKRKTLSDVLNINNNYVRTRTIKMRVLFLHKNSCLLTNLQANSYFILIIFFWTRDDILRRWV